MGVFKQQASIRDARNSASKYDCFTPEPVEIHICKEVNTFMSLHTLDFSYTAYDVKKLNIYINASIKMSNDMLELESLKGR